MKKRKGKFPFFLLWGALVLAAFRLLPGALGSRQQGSQQLEAPAPASSPAVAPAVSQPVPPVEPEAPIEAAAPVVSTSRSSPSRVSSSARRPSSLLDSGRKSIRQQDYRAASAQLQELNQLAPESREARQLQEELDQAIRSSRKKDRESKVVSFQKEAENALKAGNPEEARKFLKAADELDPSSRETFRLLQEVHRREFDQQEEQRRNEFDNRLKVGRGDRSAAPEVTVTEQADAEAPPAAGGDSDEYTVQPEDVLQITVFEEPDLTARVRVSRSGEITYPLLGRVSVAGLTVSGVQEKLTNLLGEDFLVHPQVQVFIDTPRAVSVTGKVVKPGSYPISTERSMTIMEVITLAGGFTEDADLNGTKIIRLSGKNKETIRVRVTDIIRKGDKSKDVPVRAGDIIYVPESFF